MRDRSEEGDSEGYFASASDLVVGVLFFFLPMLALNFWDDSTRLNKLRARAEVAEAETVTALAEAERAEATAREALVAAERQLVAARTAEAEAGRLWAKSVALRSRLQEANDKLPQKFADRQAARSSLMQPGGKKSTGATRCPRARGAADPVYSRPALGRTLCGDGI